MFSENTQKQSIELNDYNYRHDITNRLFMARLSLFEVDVLREVVNASLKFSSSEIVENLNTEESLLQPVLTKLIQIGLINVKDKTIIVDKELRKYYQTNIIKFEDNFQPGMEFLLGMLSKVPIHCLPSWYAISKISDDIFQSIIEKYFLTSRTYERYLQELKFDDPILPKMMKDVFLSPELKISARILMQKHGLSHEEFEKKMLMLEYNFVCCLAYERTEDKWEEIVIPFHEWREYLLFKRRTFPVTIDNGHIVRFHPSDFGFIEDLALVLEALPVKAVKESSAITAVSELLPHLTKTPSLQEYAERVIENGKLLRLMGISNKQLCLTQKGCEWLKLTMQDRAQSLYWLPASLNISNGIKFGDREMRELEKGLRGIAKAGWIYVDAFLENMTIQIGRAAPVTLKKKGKHWWYELPAYGEEEKNLIKTLICGKLFDSGYVSIGWHHDHLCFCITPFGRMMLEA